MGTKSGSCMQCIRPMQELQNNVDKGVGLKGMKRVKPYMKEMIITDGKWHDVFTYPCTTPLCPDPAIDCSLW